MELALAQNLRSLRVDRLAIARLDIGKRSRSHYHVFTWILFCTQSAGFIPRSIFRTGSREDYWGDVVSEIRLDDSSFTPDALEGLSEFSHVEVLFYLHGVSEKAVVSGLRHPRSNPNWPQVGIFAQRGKARPNRIAATICRLLSVQGLIVNSARTGRVRRLAGVGYQTSVRGIHSRANRDPAAQVVT